jgi:superfamily I DNA and/or RNA helicase
LARPFFRYSGVELTKVFNESKNDTDKLKTLFEELCHRKKPKMVKLRQQVQVRIRNLKRQTQAPLPPESSQPEKTQADSKPKAHVDTAKSSKTTKKTKSRGQYSRYKDPFEEMNQSPKGTAKIRASGDIRDVPSKFQFNLKRDVELGFEKSVNLVTRYEKGLRALIAEMRKKGAGAKKIMLENGARIKVDGHNVGYQFPYDGDADLFEGAKVQATIGSSHTDGQIAAVYGKKIILGLLDDFGPLISRCLLMVDNTAMIEALRSRLEKLGNKEVLDFNERLANAVIFNEGNEELPGILPESQVRGLNAKQRETALKITTNEVFYIWGPPGTGKTKTLGAVNETLFDDKKKVLLCSNTNQAVDQVLLKLCKKFGVSHIALEEGQIIRIGKISHSELENNWSQYVTLDGIVDRKSATLNKQKIELEKEIEGINHKQTEILKINEQFKHLDQLKSQRNDLNIKLSGSSQKIKDAEKQKEQAVNRLSKLRVEKEKVKDAGLLRFFRRSIEAVENDIQNIISKIEELNKAINTAKQRMHELAPKFEKLGVQTDRVERLLGKYDRTAIEKQIEKINEEKQPIIQAISKINKELEHVAKAVLTNAKIVGATVTKVFLSPQLFSGFDVVIVDEASMVMLPALFHAAGLAKEKVVISGDFRQLSPIIQTEQQEIFDAVGGDVFQTSGLVNAFQEGRSMKRSVMLDEQYRMDDNICKIISLRMYSNKLKTSPERNPTDKIAPKPFHRPLTIVDTSTIYPFSNKDTFKSRYNLMHALAIRNLCLHFQIESFLTDRSVGVCTPYAAQSKLLKKVLKGSNLGMVDTGTVHHYQGDQKLLMILDVPDSLGEQYAGIFLQANTPEDDGARLFNVAVSRSKEHLIVFANLAFLDRKLPNHAILRDILSEMQDQGAVIDVRDVLSLWPIMEDLKQYGQAFDLSPESEKTGLFNQKDFEIVCGADLKRAEKSIVIFSGFITEQRVAAYESLFRLKTAEEVKIRCVSRPPHRNGGIPEENGKMALNGLEKMGCIVDTRGNIHEKAVIIDGNIVWFGSLNPLSHTAKTAEVMARMESKEVARQLVTFLAIDRKAKQDDAGEFFTSKENPDCPNCKARVAYMVGRYGPYWDCEDCNWRESVGKNGSGYRSGRRKYTEKGPACPKCGSVTIKRSGRFGEFFGCSTYPDCKGTVKIKS